MSEKQKSVEDLILELQQKSEAYEPIDRIYSNALVLMRIGKVGIRFFEGFENPEEYINWLIEGIREAVKKL